MSVRTEAMRARKLRRDSTDAERQLWRALREAGVPVKVRRQHPIGEYIADFVIPACKLVIELDGGQHASQAGADAVRSRALEDRGYRVIRFWNNEVLKNMDGVLETILAEIGANPTSP